MPQPSQDLQQWIPRLIAAWRRMAQAPAQGLPQDRLEAHEASRVARALAGLSAGLKGGRGLAGADYMSHPDLLGAYLLWFWPVSYLQARASLLEAGIPGSGAALDLGSGPGPMALALADHGFTRVLAAERSPQALALLRRLSKAGGGRVQAVEWQAPEDPGAPGGLPEGGPWGLVSLGHVANELYLASPEPLASRAALLASCAGSLSPGGALLLIEPALLGTSREGLALRDRMLAAGLSLRWPCLWQAACPALKQEGQTCHSEFAWEAPAITAQLGLRAGLKKESLKCLALAFGEPLPAPEGAWRVVGGHLLSKNGTRRLMVCGKGGRMNLSLPKAVRTDQAPAFLGLKRGDLVLAQGTEAKASGMALRDGSQCQRLHACQPLLSKPQRVGRTLHRSSWTSSNSRA
jgi:SAM-dependent methyltransferase